MIKVPKDQLIEFTNLVNECCTVMEHDEVATWLTAPNSNFNMDKPIDFFGERVARRFIGFYILST